MIARMSVAAALACVVTFSLLFAMQQMILSGEGTRRVTREDAPDPVRLTRRHEPPALADEHWSRPERPPQPVSRPASLERVLPGQAPVTLALDIAMPDFERRPAAPPQLASAGDADIRPIVKVAPTYPEVAVKRNIQGHVLIEFTVAADGTVRDITVLESTAPVLEATAIRAALQFEFTPRVVDGEPVETPGVLNRFVFTLNEPQPTPVPL